MVSKVNKGNPAIVQLIKPLFVIKVVFTMHIEYVFAYQNEFVDSRIHHGSDDFIFENHNVVVDTIVPLANELDYPKAGFIIGEDNFQVKGLRAEIVPLRMDEIIVDYLAKLELTILSSIERRFFIL